MFLDVFRGFVFVRVLNYGRSLGRVMVVIELIGIFFLMEDIVIDVFEE